MTSFARFGCMERMSPEIILAEFAVKITFWIGATVVFDDFVFPDTFLLVDDHGMFWENRNLRSF
jgi:hypothetical protein